MASTKDKVLAEMENITRVMFEVEKTKKISDKELVVLVGIGAYLQNIYTGMENILKQILVHRNIPIPDTPTWHKDLLNLAVEHKVITKGTADKVGKYLFFRHFFAHTYGFLLDEAKLEPLVNDLPDTYSKFRMEIDCCLAAIEE